MNENVKQWKSTIAGIAPSVIGLLVLLGVVKVDDQPSILEGINAVLDSGEAIVVQVTGLISTVSGLWSIFKSKD